MATPHCNKPLVYSMRRIKPIKSCNKTRQLTLCKVEHCHPLFTLDNIEKQKEHLSISPRKHTNFNIHFMMKWNSLFEQNAQPNCIWQIC